MYFMDVHDSLERYWQLLENKQLWDRLQTEVVLGSKALKYYPTFVEKVEHWLVQKTKVING